MQQAPAGTSTRVTAAGKFLWRDGRKLYLRGVTWGPFRPRADGSVHATPATASRDFARMRAAGVNAIRTYSEPPRWLLDVAHEHGLGVLAGAAWEQHVAFLDDRRRARAIEARVAAAARALAGHPALLAVAVGNEIPSSMVRWLGAERVARFLERLCLRVKEQDPETLVTYVNYPTTEYLRLDFLDLACFNVYLEDPETLAAYLARLQNLAGDRPLVLGETGLDSRRHGEKRQALAVEWQLRSAYAMGLAGAFVFAWTDEWHRGGHEIEDWDFGLTRRDRSPKPALESARRAFDDVPFPASLRWPSVSVVVCTFNGSSTIRDTLEHLGRLAYPAYEVIVVDDGSTDATAAIAREYPVRLVSTPNHGLARARNLGLELAAGDIVAYIDDDAYPDPHWLDYLVRVLVTGRHAGAGGPNVPPPGAGPVAAAVARAPGGPAHVLVSDTVAEHVPGCNMAFWRKALVEVGGFDPVFRAAGDDVDLCWRLQARGHTLGFSPAAQVWHHRRNSLKAYWKQQTGYGRAEALLERKWPERYNVAGHISWTGRIYATGLTAALVGRRHRIYHGVWGTAPFQSLYESGPGTLGAFTLMPEWLLVVAVLTGFSLMGLLWSPALATLPVALAAGGATVLQAWRSSADPRPGRRGEGLRRLGLRSLTTLLHVIQPAARLRGRLLHGLTPWRRRGIAGFLVPWRRERRFWSETWIDPVERLGRVERVLQAAGAVVRRGGAWDGFDLDVRGGLLGGARLRLGLEEHGAGRQLARWRKWPRLARAGTALAGLLALLAGLAAADGAVAASATFGLVALAIAGKALGDAAGALAAFDRALVEVSGGNGTELGGRDRGRDGASP